MKNFLTVLITLAGLLFIMAIFALSGLYDIGAVKPHYAPVTWMIELARNRSISEHSKNIQVPARMEDKRMIAEGLDHYHSMCRWCHGAPGFKRSEFALGLYPNPPYLVSGDTQDRRANELFWIVKNGIKMTGMPAFGPTHTDDQLWGIVAFLRRLPKLPLEEYKAMAEATAPLQKEGNDHHHQDHGRK